MVGLPKLADATLENHDVAEYYDSGRCQVYFRMVVLVQQDPLQSDYWKDRCNILSQKGNGEVLEGENLMRANKKGTQVHKIRPNRARDLIHCRDGAGDLRCDAL